MLDSGLFLHLARSKQGTSVMGVSFFMATKFHPSWKSYEKQLHDSDPKKAEEASDKFYLDRKHELEVDPRARKWEESRKQSAAKEKPEWVKQKRQEESQPLQKLIRELRKGGSFMKILIPSPGFLVIDPIKHNEGVRDSGIYVPNEHSDTPNTARVWRTSDYKVLSNGEKQEPSFKDGDEVLVRKGAGLEIQEKGKDLIFISYEDVLGVMKDN